jgi:dUTP pyrophosphatase
MPNKDTQKRRGFEPVKEEAKKNFLEVTLFDGKKQKVYPVIPLPIRADRRSAGYDFFLAQDVLLLPAHKTIVWSDVKAYMEEDEVLEMHIRSSLGIKQGIILSNITGIIDSSYYGNENNDGNIAFALLNTSGVGVELKAGERVAQGIFQKYLVADNDHVQNETRTGGIGSSGK